MKASTAARARWYALPMYISRAVRARSQSLMHVSPTKIQVVPGGKHRRWPLPLRAGDEDAEGRTIGGFHSARCSSGKQFELAGYWIASGHTYPLAIFSSCAGAVPSSLDDAHHDCATLTSTDPPSLNAKSPARCRTVVEVC